MSRRCQARKIIIASASLATLAACSTPKHQDLPEDPKVAERCTPVKALLAKNYRSDGKAHLTLGKWGGTVERTGPVLSPQEAAHIAQLDAACRAWVYGIISDQDYARMLLGITSATIVQTSSPTERDAIAASVAEILQDLKQQGLLPSPVDPSAIPAKVKADSSLSPEVLEETLRKSMAEINEKLSPYIYELGMRKQIFDRLEAIEKYLAANSGAGKKPSVAGNGGVTSERDSDNANPPSQSNNDQNKESLVTTTKLPPSDLTVYFSSNSAELAHDERIRIKEAARLWYFARVEVEVSGYADPRGNPGDNRKLANGRAQEVKRLLYAEGVPARIVKGPATSEAGADYEQLRKAYIRAAD